jgi:hypothetical protein
VPSQAAINNQKEIKRSRVVLNAFIGLIVGLAGGLVGLGGAELRLPYARRVVGGLVAAAASFATMLSKSRWHADLNRSTAPTSKWSAYRTGGPETVTQCNGCWPPDWLWLNQLVWHSARILIPPHPRRLQTVTYSIA